MNKKRILIYALVAALLAALFYLQFRAWRRFDWALFLGQTQQVTHGFGPLHILMGIVFTYVAYFMRVLRWQIFLRPVRKTNAADLVAPTLIGFTGIALLGRLGEMIRPYLISRRTSLSFSSQMAVWTVERIFDFGGFAVLLVSAIFFSSSVRSLTYYAQFRKGGLLLIFFVAGLAATAWIIHAKGDVIAELVERKLSPLAAGFGHKIGARVREFRGGLDTIHGLSEFVQLAVVSIGMWFVIALAYHEVLKAYGTSLGAIAVPQIFLLIFASMIGSLVQLPGVGGGSQLATITTLQRVFHAPPELAASGGILMWMVTFMTVIPSGLLLTHREQLSLRKLSQESRGQEEIAKT